MICLVLSGSSKLALSITEASISVQYRKDSSKSIVSPFTLPIPLPMKVDLLFPSSAAISIVGFVGLHKAKYSHP